MNVAVGEFPSKGWVEGWIEVINNDAQIGRLGRYFDALVLFDFGGDRYILRLNAARVADYIHAPPWDESWDFRIAASVDCWKNSMKDPPPPFYQDLHGMIWNHGMILEGNVNKAMQNIRVFKMIMGSMKQVG